MQIPGSFPKGGLPPPPGGSSSDISRQLRQQRKHHQRILRLRALQFWSYPIVLVILGGIVAAILGQSAFDYPKETFGGLVVAFLFFLSILYPEFGLVLMAIMVTPFVPTAIKFDSLYISPAVPLLAWLLCIVLVQAAFRVKQLTVPSFWTIWPIMGLLALACISEIMAQVTWLHDVPHVILGAPASFDESVGLVVYCMPLLTVFVVVACLTGRGKWVQYIQYAYMGMALLGSVVILLTFRRIGADIYTFRYTSPSIGWMPLEALAQLLALGCIIAYAHFLCVPTWRLRILYGGILGVCLLALYFSLENSWWLEAIVGMAIITIIYSRKLLVFFCIAGLPFVPVALSFIHKLQSVKSVDYYRLLIWKDMLHVWSKRPILGVGSGNVWAYDKVFTQLPQGLRNIDVSGLGVAHNGYLQTLAELGPLGLFFQVSFLVVLFLAAVRLFRRSKAPEKLRDRVLGLSGLGLVCGSFAGDFVAGYFFLPPRQALHFVSLPQALTAWVLYGCVIYKDQLWRMARRGIKVSDEL